MFAKVCTLNHEYQHHHHSFSSICMSKWSISSFRVYRPLQFWLWRTVFNGKILLFFSACSWFELLVYSGWRCCWVTFSKEKYMLVYSKPCEEMKISKMNESLWLFNFLGMILQLLESFFQGFIRESKAKVLTWKDRRER